ncbi:plastin-3 [Paragonimus westermani]|uniref:Plastin-3 n=1 Tax=Paragonimus westermani TaxID=34504 RepID=A0A5J4NIR0_9TREM|nr:plastin-3 [Paragonimus westermani]
MHENITLALNSARAIGCNVVNIGAGDILNCTKHLLLGLLWQVIKIGLLKQINVVAHAELATLLDGDETINDFAKLAPEDILIRWVNYHLKGTDSDTRMHNFTADVRNCEVYAYLVEKIAPQEKKQFMHSTKAILDAVDLVQRAEMVLQNAEMLDCRVFVRPQDIVSGSQRLNLAFLANLFHGYPALEKPPDVEEKVAKIEETREEKSKGHTVTFSPFLHTKLIRTIQANPVRFPLTAYRNWINSMGIEPAVNHLFCDLTDGIILLKLFDVIRKNTVDWSQVHDDICKTPAKANFQRLENCNYVIKLGRDFGFSLVGLGGDDLYEGKAKMTLALLWQLMRAYTLSVLTRLTESRRTKKSVRHKDAHGYSPIAETEIIDWANEKLRQGGKQARISSSLGFADPNLATGNLIIDLIDSIRPGSVNYKVVSPGRSKQDQLANCQYAIPLARRIGATVYAVPEDIVELKSKMIMTVFACLMAVDLEAADKQKSAYHSEVQTTMKRAVKSNPQQMKEYRNEVAINSYMYTSGIPPETLNCDQRRRESYSKTDKERNMSEKIYVKTLNFTVSNSQENKKTPTSRVFTKSGGAGDCMENALTERHHKSYNVNRGNTGPVRARPRFLSPAGTRSSSAHSDYPESSNGTKASGNNWYTSGQYERSKLRNLSRSIPTIHIFEDDELDAIEHCELVDAHSTTKEKSHSDMMDRPSVDHGQITSCPKPCEQKRNTNEMMNRVEKIEERLSVWKQEGRAYRSHGGGRLFMATKCKK